MFSSSADIYDALYAFRDMRAETERALSLLRRYARRPLRSALDVGCATGDHAAFLVDAGLDDVQGLDIDRRLVAAARKKHSQLRIHHADFLSSRLGRTYDAIVSFYGVIAYVRTARRLTTFAQNVARHLAPGGVALIEPWHLAGAYAPGPTARHVLTPEVAIARASVARRSGSTVRLDVHYVIARGARARHVHEVHRLGLFTREQHLDAFRQAGLRARWLRESPSGRGCLVATMPG